MDEIKTVEIPETGIEYGEGKPWFVIYKNDFNGKIAFNKEEASLLLIKLYKFVMNETRL